MGANKLWKLAKGDLSIPIAVAQDGGLPSEILLFKKGITNTENGPYKFSDLSKKLIEKEIQRRNIRYFSDWHHASLDEAPLDPRRAASASSHYDLEFRGGDLWATNIEWTPDGADDLKNKRYMYISPAFDADKKTGEVMSFRNFALTNDPATHDIEALVAAESQHQESSAMDPETQKVLDEIKKSLEGVCKAHEENSKRLGKMEESHAKLAKKLNKAAEDDEDEDEEDEEDEESSKSETEDEDEEESRKSESGDDKDGDKDDEDDEDTERKENESEEEYTERMTKLAKSMRGKAGMQNQIIKLTRELARARGNVLNKNMIEQQVTIACRRGLIQKWQKPYWMAHPKGFLKLMAKSKKTIIVPPATGGVRSPTDAVPQLRTSARTLDRETLALCESMGVTPEEFISGKPTPPAAK